MSDPETSNLNLAVPTHGSDVDTWDVPLNGNMQIIDSCITAISGKVLSNVDVTLTTDETRVAVIRLAGTLASDIGITMAPSIAKPWIFENLCTQNHRVIVRGASGNVIALPPGSCQAYWDGNNMNFINLGTVGQYLDLPYSSVPGWVTGSTIPPYLLCDGSTFSSGTYPLLFFILGSTTLPDLRGRSRSYMNSGTGRITTAGSGINGDVLFSAGGAQNVTIGQTNLPNVSPSFTGNLISLGAISLNSAVPSPSGTTVSPTPSGIFGSGPAFTPSVTIPPFTPAGNISALGSGTALGSMPPTCIAGVTLIRAA